MLATKMVDMMAVYSVVRWAVRLVSLMADSMVFEMACPWESMMVFVTVMEYQ